MATSAGLAWSLANGITQEEYDKNLVDALTRAQGQGLDDAAISKEMQKWGIDPADVARATGVTTEAVQSRVDAVAPSLLATPEEAAPEPVSSGGLLDVAPVTPTATLPTTPITINSPPAAAPAAAPAATAAKQSAGLAWSLANGITQEQYDKNLVEAYKGAVAKGLSDSQIKTTMDQYGIDAADLARATGSDVKTVQSRMDLAVPKTPDEIAFDKAAKAELATRQAKADTQTKANEVAWAEQQRKNALDFAAQQKTLADTEAAKLAALRTPETNPFINAGPLNPVAPTGPVGFTRPTTGPQTFEQNFQNYQSIPAGAQYNPNVVGGTGSPYSQIMGQMKPLGNPYENALSGQSMGGFNPALYAQAASAYKTEADAADAARAAAALNASSSGGANSSADAAAATAADSAAAAAASATGNAPGSDGTPGSGAAMGGLITNVFGPDPAGPDEGQVNMMRGEYVIKKSSVNKYGRGLLDMINEGKIPAKKIRSLLD